MHIPFSVNNAHEIILCSLCCNKSKLTAPHPTPPLCATAGLDYHVGDVRFYNAVLGVEVHHGERSALGGNAA